MDRNGCIAVYHKKVCFHEVYNYDEEEICIVSSLSAWFFFCFLSIKSRRYDILSYWHGTKTLFFGGGTVQNYSTKDIYSRFELQENNHTDLKVALAITHRITMVDVFKGVHDLYDFL